MSQQNRNLSKAGSDSKKSNPTSKNNSTQIVCDWPLASHSGDVVKSEEHDGKFELVLDCHEFDPKDITVFTNDNKVSIYCDHQKRRDSNTCERKFSRTYKLPPNVNPNTLKHTFNNDGDLIITAEKK
ncbi:Alpha crystallin/Heat shock protein family and Alpha crystallin/Hsp20 domain and HSP20-like chaperone domain-containing protein [Strongyloides ratti]|uniref:Alpha crystallin/Heat shock protein family and Alpha crystallin/Hsp20 domain and HSP20-like chaperone domain-containing protein n=1 Tax=Strongyloides ratti TaxID=34506 RepID=A0A090KXX0_STRRB|nr:Alpha crystallin/Heat shock protein family and Alpha crystallin/Hsp20 domain and HSP20-like chaperone domain-containing protein [Strongyloides ratti]CEF62256.1 Alpha crystallin/Heat shock protein family and Alpha crystallin/Hsp20 domain and HSP20-like chaperone domain-containing protein [Strongyloides ratti]